jgi:tetratricopeptide (TPR) repeat protein
VPDSFTEVQWTRLPRGEAGEKFSERVLKFLGGSEYAAVASRPDVLEESRSNAAPAARHVSRPLLIGLAAVAVAVVATWFVRYEAAGPQIPDSKPAAAVTEAQKLVQQAQKIYENSDELDRETLVLADDLVKRALALDAAEPTAWLLGAQLSYRMVWQSFDASESRYAELQRQATRALTLAPELVPAKLAVANARLAVAYKNFQSASNRQDLADTEHDLLALAEQAPHDYKVQAALGQMYRFLKRPDDALRVLQRAFELSDGEPAVAADMINVLLRRNRYTQAEALVAPALARRSFGRMQVLDVWFKLTWRGDLAGAQAAVATLPGWLLREDRGAFIAWQTWLWSRRPDMALDVAQRLPRDYLRDVWFTGPRAVLTARAHELAGHHEAALADWRTVVRLADQELATSPDAVAAFFWKAWALSRLGDQAGAKATSTLLQQRNLTTNSFFSSTNLALLWSTMGRTDLAGAHLRAGFGADNDAYTVTRVMLELDPAYAALRAEPQYAGLAAAALAPAGPLAVLH